MLEFWLIHYMATLEENYQKNENPIPGTIQATKMIPMAIEDVLAFNVTYGNNELRWRK